MQPFSWVTEQVLCISGCLSPHLALHNKLCISWLLLQEGVPRQLVRQLPFCGRPTRCQLYKSHLCPIERRGEEKEIASSIRCRCSWQHFNALKPGSLIHIKLGFAPPPSKCPDLLQTIWQKRSRKGDVPHKLIDHTITPTRCSSRQPLGRKHPKKRVSKAGKRNRLGKENQAPLLVGWRWHFAAGKVPVTNKALPSLATVCVLPDMHVFLVSEVQSLLREGRGVGSLSVTHPGKSLCPRTSLP